MAEKVEIDIPGIGLIEAKNAATEAALREILEVLKNTQKDANKNAKGKGGGGKSGGGESGGGGSKEAKEGAANQSRLNKETKEGASAYKGMAGAAKVAGSSFKLIGQGAHLATYAMSGLAAGAGAAGGAILSLGKNTLDLGAKFAEVLQTMANVGDSTTAAAGALRMIPGVGGVLAGVFGAVAGAVEGSVKSYQTAASVGATFNGSVQDMSRAASGAGMTLDQFANLIKNNAENLIYLGGTTESGAKAFAGLAKELQGSGAGAELQRLGFTTEQINSGMAKYIGILGKTGALSGMTTSQIAAASGSYLKELDGLAKITGQTREEKQKEQDALMKDAQVRAAMAGMDAESQKQMMNYITSFPKEQQAAIKDMIATGNVTSEEAIKLQSMLPGVAEQTMQFGRTMQAGGKINADQMNSARNNAIKEAKDSVMRNKARGMYDKEAGEAYVGAANLASMEIDGLSKAMGEQSKATDKANLAENLTKAKQRLAEFSNGFQQALANPAMLDMLMKSFETLASFVTQIIVPAFNIFAQMLSAVIPVITGLLMPALKTLGEFMQSTIIPAFSILGTWVRDAIVPIFKQAFSIVSSVVGSLFDFLGIANDTVDGLGSFEETLYTISDFIEDNLHEVLIGFGVIMGTVLVAKVIAFGASMIATLAPLGGFIAGLASGTLSLLKNAAVLLITTGLFTLMNLPIIAVIASVGLLVYGFKKMGGDLTILGDAIKWAGSWINTLFLKLQQGIYSLLNKIPGMRGDFDNDLKGINEQLTENEANRAKLEEDMAARRKANLQAEKDAEAKKLADEKAAKDAAMNQENADKAKAAKRADDREARKAKREQDAIKNKENAELGAIDKKEEREKAAADEAKGVTVDKSDPIQMLKTFAAQQKSAFTQEAKALDDKDKARSDLALASQEYAKAVEQNGKATTDLERKAAEARMKAAEERLGKANKANESADEVVKAAAERMKAAKEGKDPGAVAAAKPKEEKTETSKAPEAPAKPTSEAKVPPINQDIQKNLEMVKAAMEKRGMTDPKYINATLANVMKETGGKVVEENLNYKNTSNDRIKSIFGSRASGKTDKELDQIKSDPKQMGEMMYGSTTKMGQQMGNTEPGDGFKYRGRGNVQLTGKSNYAAASKAIYGDNRLLDNPDLVNNPAVAAEVTAWYMQKGQAGMAKTLGIDTKNMNQDQANQLATSQIAGRAIKRGEKGYLGDEVLGKVDKFSKDAKIAGIAGAPTSEEAKKAIAEGKTKPIGSTAEDAAKARANAAANDPRRTDKPVAPAETKKEEKPVAPVAQAEVKKEEKPVAPVAQAEVKKEEKPVAPVAQAEVKKEEKPVAQAETKKEEATQTPAGAMQSLIKDGIVPTTIAFQDLIKKGIMPMLTGTQVKGLDKGAVKPENSLSPGEELVKATADAQAKMAQAKMAQARDPGTGELLSAAKDLSKSSEVQTALAQNKARGMYDKDSSKQYAAMAKILDDPLTSIADLSKIDLTKAVQPKNMSTSTSFETPKTEIIAQAEKAAAEKAAAKEKEMAEKDAKFKEAMAKAEPSSQEGALSGSSDLNTALAELIAISKRTADLNEKQLSVQSSLSGDLFA